MILASTGTEEGDRPLSELSLMAVIWAVIPFPGLQFLIWKIKSIIVIKSYFSVI